MISTAASAPSRNDPLRFMIRPTPQLRAVVTQQQALLGAADFQGMLAAVRSAFEKYTAKLLESKAGALRAQALHALMDRELAPASALPVTCGKGCSGCCYYEVEITRDEAVLLKTVVQRGFPLDLPRLELQAARERKSPEWLKFFSRENRCVFLGDDGACQVYEQRPAICRKHVVTSPAAACTTAGAEVVPVQLLLAEILLSAALSLEGVRSASLSRMLVEALREN